MYQIELFYGYEDSESGIYHAFSAKDPDTRCGDEVRVELADMLI